jgi:hypothetical protein
LIAWRLAAGFVAVRQASGMLAVTITTRTLVELLRWVGVSS